MSAQIVVPLVFSIEHYGVDMEGLKKNPKPEIQQFPTTIAPVWGQEETAIRRGAYFMAAFGLVIVAFVVWLVGFVIDGKSHPRPGSIMETDPNFAIGIAIFLMLFALSLVSALFYSGYLKPLICWKRNWIERHRLAVAATDYPLVGTNLDLVRELLTRAGQNGEIGVEWHESLSEEGTVRFSHPVVVREGDVTKLEVGSTAIIRRRGSAAAQAALLLASTPVEDATTTAS